MLLQVLPVNISGLSPIFDVVVPGQQQWNLRSVRAIASRQAGGLGSRAYTLTITDGTNSVVTAAANDVGNEPGPCIVTWANIAQASVAAASTGITDAPSPNVKLNPGYHLIGTIHDAVAGDVWTSAVVWYDYVTTGS